MKINKCILLLGLVIFLSPYIKAQKNYTANDSVAVFSYLNKAEEFFNNAVYSAALSNCEKAKKLSVDKNFSRGEAYAIIKANDILLESGDNKYGSIDPFAVIKIGTALKDSLIIAIGY